MLPVKYSSVVSTPVEAYGALGQSRDILLLSGGGPLTPGELTAPDYGPVVIELYWTRCAGGSLVGSTKYTVMANT